MDQFDPQNGPDAIHLLGREGNIIDKLCYGEGAVSMIPEGVPLCEGKPAADVAGGHSLGRENGKDSQNNREDFLDQALPSPGNL